MDPMENASRLRRKKKSILYRWLISYGIILALTVALSGGIFLALENDLSQEIERTNQMRLSIVQKELDSRLELQKKLLMQVASSPELAELTRESGLTRARRASLVRKLTEQYRSMRASHSNVKEIFVYLSAADSCLSTRGAADKEIMHDVLFTMEFDQWTAFMEEKHRGEFVLMEMVEKGSDSPRVPDVAYACSYPMSPAARPRATVLVVMSDGLLGEKLEALCTRREQREPLQYLCGIWSFLDFDLAVGPGVLCPRADTEVVAEAAANTLTGIAAPRVLDLCAGTGCLGLGVKRFCPAAQVTCVEKSPEAFVYLEKNCRCALKGQGGQTEDLLEPTAFEQADAPAFDWGPALNALRAKAKPAYAVQPVEGDLFTYWQGLPEGQLDLIVSNPPYLTAEEMRHLQPEVAQEPAMALEAGEDGLVFYRALAEHYQNALRPGGALVLEIGWQQRQAVAALLAANGWADIECRKDFGGNDRCMIAHRPEK